MKNTAKMIEDGKRLMNKHPRADLTANEINNVYEMNKDDLFEMISAFYLIGVSTGKRLADSERQKP